MQQINESFPLEYLSYSVIYSLFSTLKGNTKQFFVFRFRNSRVQTSLTTETFSIVNMRVGMDKNLDKNVFNNIKTTIGSPPKPALCKIS